MPNHLHWDVFGLYFSACSLSMVYLAAALTHGLTIGNTDKTLLNGNNSVASLISLLFTPSTLDIVHCRLIRVASQFPPVKCDNGSFGDDNVHWHKTTLEQNPRTYEKINTAHGFHAGSVWFQ